MAKLAYGGKDLTVPFPAIETTGGKLMVGLWDYENGAWRQNRSPTAAEVVAGVEDNHKLVVVRGSEEEAAMVDTIFAARDLAMAKSDTYDPADEFKGITVKVNGRTIDNFDPRPGSWRMVNMSQIPEENGLVVFRPNPSSNEIVYEAGSP